MFKSFGFQYLGFQRQDMLRFLQLLLAAVNGGGGGGGGGGVGGGGGGAHP